MFTPAILHFDTPETTGKLLSGDVTVNIKYSTPEYVFGSHTTNTFFTNANSVDTSETASQQDSGSLGIKLGILDNLDFFNFSEGIFGLKVQLLGSPRIAKEEGWKLSLAAGVGDYASTSNTDFFGPKSEANVAASGTSYDLSLNTGYRFNSFALLYINIFHSKSDVTGTISSGNSVLLQKNRTNKIDGALIGINIMIADKSTFFTLEGGIAKSI